MSVKEKRSILFSNYFYSLFGISLFSNFSLSLLLCCNENLDLFLSFFVLTKSENYLKPKNYEGSIPLGLAEQRLLNTCSLQDECNHIDLYGLGLLT